jgi:hypothetical protein
MFDLKSWLNGRARAAAPVSNTKAMHSGSPRWLEKCGASGGIANDEDRIGAVLAGEEAAHPVPAWRNRSEVGPELPAKNVSREKQEAHMHSLSKVRSKEVSMLRTVLCCTLVVAAAAMGWETMSSVDYPAEVQAGSAITYGDGKIWGIFPDPSDSNWTHFEYYDPDSAFWFYPGINYDLDFLGDPAITFDWRFGGEVLVVGNVDGDPYSPTLFSYSLTESDWDYEDIDDFYLGAGASVAFCPASGYYGTYVAGWMYCLAGFGTEFWRYSIPGPGDQKINGICPGETSLIADQTPLFLWTSGSNQNRLQVSTNPSFLDTLIDEVLSIPEYEVVTDLENGVYYWRSGVYYGGTWSWSSTHSFTLEGGWTQLRDIPMEVSYGASLAYEKDFYSNDERLLALVGDSSWYYYTYSVADDTWYEFTTPRAQSVGSAIVTHEAASATPPGAPGPWAVFGEDSDSLYNLTVKFGWRSYVDAGVFPQSLGAGASLAYSIESGVHYIYLIVGQDGNGDPRNDFYRQELPSYRGSEQGRAARLAPLPVRLVSSPGNVTIEYQLTAPARVRATVFDAAGRQIRVLHAGTQPAGTHQLSWNTAAPDHGACSGAYFVLLDTGTEQARLKVVVK